MKGCRPWSEREITEILFQSSRVFSPTSLKRNRCLFLLGINTGFRISEMLSLCIDDVLEKGSVKRHIEVRRRNMKGRRSGRAVYLNAAARRGIQVYLAHLQAKGQLQGDAPLFVGHGQRAISRTQAWRIIRKVCQEAQLAGRTGTHSLRKTFANRVYDHFLDKQVKGERVDAFRATSKALGHSDIRSTDQYLSFREEELEDALDRIAHE